MNRIYLTILTTFIGLTALTQGLTGIVKDSTSNTGIPFVFLHLVDIDAAVTTDIHGHFELPASLPLPIKIKCNALGFDSRIMIFDEKPSTATIIYLTPSHFELNEVNITVSPGIHQRFNMSNVTSKSIAELSAIVSPNLTEGLSNIGSVYNNSTGNGIGKPVIRGLSGSRVLTVLNGLRIENQQWGGDHGLGVSELGIDQVDLIKGPSSLIYGADALGGVIHLTDEKYTTAGNIELKLNSLFESNSLSTKNKFGLKLAKSQLRFNIYGYYLNAADYQLPTGEFAQNSRWQEGAFKAAIGYNTKNWVMNARYNYNRSFIGLPGHTHDSIVDVTAFRVKQQDRKWILPVQQINSHFLVLDNSFYFDKSDLKIQGGFTTNRLDEYEEKISIPGISNLLNTYSYQIKYRYKLSTSHQLLTGYQGLYQQNINLPQGEETLMPSSDMLDNGAFVLWNWSKNNWESQLGARYDQRFLKTESNDYDFQGFNGSAGIVKRIALFTLRLNLSSGYRPPNLSELAANGVHHGNMRYELGSSVLKPEFAQQADFNVSWESEHFSVVVNPFMNQINNFVYLAPTDSAIQGYQLFKYQQSNKAILTGGDLGIHYHPHFLHPLHLESTVSYLYSEDEFGKGLPMIPQTRINTTAKFSFKSKGKLQIQNIHLQHLYYFDQKRVSTDETTSPMYQLLHLGIQLKANWKHPLTAKIGVRNLLNEAYIDHLSRLKNIALEAPGRNFYVGLQWQITKTKNLHNHEK